MEVENFYESDPHLLAQELLKLPATDRVQGNQLGNLVITRNGTYVGWIEVRAWGIVTHWNSAEDGGIQP